MTVRLYKLLHALLPALALLSLASCVFDDDAATADDGSDAMQIYFTLVTSGSGASVTRADETWGPGWQGADRRDTALIGDLYETLIKPDELQVLLYTTGTDKDKFICKVENLSYYRVDESANRYIYKFSGRIPKGKFSDGTFSAKIVVLANCPDYTPTENAPLSDMGTQTFDYTPAQFAGPSPEKAIPMWGVKTVTDAQLRAGLATDIGDIWLLHAMAKVKVSLSEASQQKGLKLSSAKLNGYSQQGYVVPAAFANVDETSSIKTENETGGSFNPVTTTAQVTTPAIPFTKADDNTYFYIYVPEYNTVEGNASITVGISYAYEQEFTFKLDINLVRNHIYHYEADFEGVTVTLKYRAEPWDTGGGTVEFD